MLIIDLLRHGETQAAQATLHGASDVGLSELGKQQLLAAAQHMDIEASCRITVSPLQRCAWLGKQLQQRRSTSLHLDAGFAEMDFGDWEGQRTQDLIAQGIDFRHDVTRLNPPNGESFCQFLQRVTKSWQVYIDLHIQDGGHHILITHGGVMRVLLGMVLKIPEQHLGKLHIPHATWSRITYVAGKAPVLWFMNREA